MRTLTRRRKLRMLCVEVPHRAHILRTAIPSGQVRVTPGTAGVFRARQADCATMFDVAKTATNRRRHLVGMVWGSVVAFRTSIISDLRPEEAQSRRMADFTFLAKHGVRC